MARAHMAARGRQHTARAEQRPIHDVMTRDPAWCLPSDAARKAARIMLEKDTGIVPVIDNEGHRALVGVVTDRDLCLCLIAEGRDGNTPVEACMTSKTVCCRPEDSAKKAVDLMEENQVRRIPVVDAENRIRGIVSMADVVRRSDIAGEKTLEALEKICEPTGQPSKPRAQARRRA